MAAPPLLLLPIRHARAGAEVSCGGHTAAECALCPQGHGPLWCNGDCIWKDGRCVVQMNLFDWVSCGGHRATRCAECTGPTHISSWCNGDCTWERSQCVMQREIPELDDLIVDLDRLGHKLDRATPSVPNYAVYIRNAIVGSGSRQKQAERLERHLQRLRDRKPLLDALFWLLPKARSDAEANDIESLIWIALRWHSNEGLHQQMIKVEHALNFGLLSDALNLTYTLTHADPYFAEAWNKRAVVMSNMEKHEESMEPIERVLELEPRHFGALVGKSKLLAQNGSSIEALRLLERARDLYPRLERSGLQGLVLEAQRAVDALEADARMVSF